MTSRYETYAEASEAAQRLGFKSAREYQTGYRKDPKLPSDPRRIYADYWVEWHDFLGKKAPKEFYPTLLEASGASQRLGFKSIKEYKKGYQEDPKLPSNPRQIYADDWVSWYDFFGTEAPGQRFYPTHAEASEAAQRLGFKTSPEYEKNYRKDPELPSHPYRSYADDWVSWHDFLGEKAPEEKYPTYAEASEAAQRLGFKGAKEYQTGYQKDPKLPSNPGRVYADDWESWYDFLGTEAPGQRFYPTHAEASEAAQRLGLKSSSEYAKGYRKDPKLPSNPNHVYADDWESWYDFLGTEAPEENYPTYAEASEAAQRLGLKTSIAYAEGYQKDPKLPSHPKESYPDDWVNWPIFLGGKNAFNPELLTLYPRFFKAIDRYVESGTNQTAKNSQLRAFVKGYVYPQMLADDPGAMLSRDTFFSEVAYEAFINDTGETLKRSRHNICCDFFDWVLENYCSDEDDDGELIVLPGYRNPLRTALKGLLDQLPSYRRNESNKPPLPMDAILRAKNHLIPPQATSFRDLYQLHPFLQDCWFEVDPNLIDSDGPNCICRKVTKDRKKPNGERFPEDVWELWSPVKLVANYVLLSMPLRGQQICWLDSGEGDEFLTVWSGGKMNGKVEWIKNQSHLATRKRNQGFIQKADESGEVGSYITTNKTGIRQGGYSIPWMPEDLSYWIIQLREWQSKYTPIKELTAWTTIRLRQRTHQDILKRRGKQAFLFRDPASSACPEKVSPMFTTTAFTRTVPALLYHSQRPGEGLANRIEKKGKGMDDYKSAFTPHSLRVSLITAYIVEGRAPITVISKLVGHSNLVMTIYYTKIGNGQMRKELMAAEKRALDQSLDRYQDLVLHKRIAEARSELVARDLRILDDCLNSDWPSAAFQFMSFGICPMSGAKCDEGGELLVDRISEAQYAPVANGYLGKRNCLRCRFFITGPAFLGGLSAITNEVILEINVISKEYHALQAQRWELDDERYDAESEGLLFDREKELRKVTAAYEERAQKLDMLTTDLQYLWLLKVQSEDALKEAKPDKHQLLVREDYVEFGMHLEEQQSDFRLLAEVCANAEIYKGASASRAQPLLSQMLDQLADTNGIAPAMFKLSQEEQLKVANQVVQLIMQTTQHDWHLADQLVTGQILLEDLAGPLRLNDIRREIESVMREPVKTPLRLKGCKS